MMNIIRRGRPRITRRDRAALVEELRCRREMLVRDRWNAADFTDRERSLIGFHIETIDMALEFTERKFERK